MLFVCRWSSNSNFVDTMNLQPVLKACVAEQNIGYFEPRGPFSHHAHFLKHQVYGVSPCGVPNLWSSDVRYQRHVCPFLCVFMLQLPVPNQTMNDFPQSQYQIPCVLRSCSR